MSDMPVSPKAPKKGKRKIEEYEAESAMRTMMEAEKHKADPHMMEAVHKLAGRHMKQIKGIKTLADLKRVRDEYHGMKPAADPDAAAADEEID
jgi:hypothetical protein